MSEENAPNKKKRRNRDVSFSDELGDLSPIEGFRGPKTPSNRQVLRFFLFLISVGNTLNDAASKVVEAVLAKHPTSVSKSPHRLRLDVLNLHKEARLYIVSFHCYSLKQKSKIKKKKGK